MNWFKYEPTQKESEALKDAGGLVVNLKLSMEEFALRIWVRAKLADKGYSADEIRYAIRNIFQILY